MAMTLYSERWQFFKDDGAEPTIALPGGQVTNNKVPPGDIFRLRSCVIPSGGSQSGGVLKLQWTTDLVNFYDLGSDQPFDYADGQGVKGDLITTYKLLNSNAYGHFHEDALGTEDWNQNEKKEVDFAIIGTRYYPSKWYGFRLVNDVTALSLYGSPGIWPSVTWDWLKVVIGNTWKESNGDIEILVDGVWCGISDMKMCVSGAWKSLTY